MKPRRLYLAGKTFGAWTVLSRSHSDSHKAVHWLCRCACGTERTLLAQVLTHGESGSCGCRTAEALSARSRTHGHASGRRLTSEYLAWIQLRYRCSDGNTDPNDRRNYRDRGIRVCARWDSFETFLADVGPRPSSEHSIDRINNDGHYEPSNVRWATRYEQMANTRRTRRFITVDGDVICLRDVARNLAMSPHALRSRLISSGVIGRRVS